MESYSLKRIAVIGSGISGLAAAYYLSRKHQVFLFEKDSRLGGHTHTVTVNSSRGPLPIDTGFIVHNDRTYPNLIRLLAELGVPRVNSDMSFAVSCRKTGYEYSSRGLRGYFAQRKNLLRRRPWHLFREMRRFNQVGGEFVERQEADALTMGEFIDQQKFSPEFCEFYLYPMASAVWSCTHHAVRDFPAATLLRFFGNHGMLTVNGHPQWKTIPGGTSSYIPPMIAPLQDRISKGVNIRAVRRRETFVTLDFADGRPAQRFDEVVFATHGNQILPLLEAPTDAEREVLGNFETSPNHVALHTDDDLLPKRHDARASWNYLLHLDGRNGHGPATLTYHMNRLQSLQTREHYCVTLNAGSRIRGDRLLRDFIYNHPLYTRRAIASQKRWQDISGRNRTHFCGAYWFYGFHEDGVNSALRVARSLGVPV